MMRLLLRRMSDEIYLPGQNGGKRGKRQIAPYELRMNGLRVGFNHTQGLIVLAFFCHKILSEMDLVEIHWPDPDTMPDQWRNCLGSEICRLNKLLVDVGARVIRRQGYYRMIEVQEVGMAA